MTTERISFRVRPQLKRRLKREAEQRGLTLSDLMKFAVALLERFLNTEIDLQGNLGEVLMERLREE